MYKLLLFTGGVYKFNEFEEFVEDIGGLIVQIESLKISRSMYFLSEEIKVLIIIPSKEENELKTLAKQIKGNIKTIDMKESEIEKIVLIFEIYKNLKTNEYMDLKTIIHYLKNNQDFIKLEEEYKFENICNYDEFKEKIFELLYIMEEMKIIERIRKKEIYEYKLKTKIANSYLKEIYE